MNINKIRFERTNFNMGTIVNWVDRGYFEIPTEQPLVWSPEKQSNFVVSLIVYMPFPELWVWQHTWQETESMRILNNANPFLSYYNFIRSRSTIINPFFFAEYDGYTFEMLPISLQRRIVEGINVNVNIIHKNTPLAMLNNIISLLEFNKQD